MTSLADRTIASLRSSHDELVALVSDLSDEQLATASGASDWSVAQVLSHLGSGAEITGASFHAAVDDTATPEQGYNEAVWERWGALSAREQATAFREHDAGLVGALESLTSEDRENLQIKVGFLPAPLPLDTFAGMRLHETAQHSWDAHVALDPAATLDATSAEVLVDHFTGGLGFLLGFMSKADKLPKPTVVRIGDVDVAIAVDDRVSLSAATGATATFHGELEAAIRLLAGRLKPPYTPPDVEVTGNVTLDDLRRAFPGL